MLRFAFLNEGDEAAVVSLGQSCLFGQGGVVIASNVAVVGGKGGGGEIQCEKTAAGTAGLALQYRVGAMPGSDEPMGDLLLRTCVLPERDEPYLLSLELARRRIMLMLEQLEDWGLFDLPEDSPVMHHFAAARDAFAHALVSQKTNGQRSLGGYSLEADRQARLALTLCVAVGEELALQRADQQLAQRAAGTEYKRAFAKATRAVEGDEAPGAPVRSLEGQSVVLPMLARVGCAVTPTAFDERVAGHLRSSCDFVTVPMRWVDMEPQEGAYSFAGTDKWIEWAVRKAKVPVVAGPIIDLRAAAIPDWLHIWENDYETLRELVYEHVRQIVIRYRRAVPVWTVVSGVHASENFHLAPDQVIDLTRVCTMVVRKLHPKARVQVEVTHPWGEYGATAKNALPPRLYCELISQAAVSFDVLGIRLQMGEPVAGGATRDLLAISEMLDRFAEFERPIALTAFGAPSTMLAERDGRVPGQWGGAWSIERQAAWVSAVGRLATSKPYVQSICWQELADVPGQFEMPSGGLVDSSGEPKAALGRLAELRRQMRTARESGTSR
jgi:Glycosyl hydrolase family 10